MSFSGFSFKHCERNKMLEEKNVPVPRINETGTTIAGVIFQDGVVLGADTRSTQENMIVDSNCNKMHYLGENIYCCGSGVVADVENLAQVVSSHIQLMTLNSGHRPRVCSFVRVMKQTLHRFRGYIAANLIVGGVDFTGPHLVTIYPHGSSDVLPFAASGTGGVAAMAVLESFYQPGMMQGDAERLVRASIKAGLDNDLASGSSIDIRTIRMNSTVRTFEQDIYAKGQSQGTYIYKPGTTVIISEDVKML